MKSSLLLKPIFLVTFSLLLFNLCAQAQGNQSFWVNDPQTNSLTSPNGVYKFMVHSSGLKIIKQSSTIWSREIFGFQKVIVLNSGNLEAIEPHENDTVWSTGVTKKDVKNATLKMQDDGNLVLYAGDGKALWATGTCGGVLNGCGSEGTR